MITCRNARQLSLSNTNLDDACVAIMAEMLRESNPCHICSYQVPSIPDLSRSPLALPPLLPPPSLSDTHAHMICAYVIYVFLRPHARARRAHQGLHLKLAELDMSYNRIGDAGAKHLASALEVPHCICPPPMLFRKSLAFHPLCRRRLLPLPLFSHFSPCRMLRATAAHLNSPLQMGVRAPACVSVRASVPLISLLSPPPLSSPLLPSPTPKAEERSAAGARPRRQPHRCRGSTGSRRRGYSEPVLPRASLAVHFCSLQRKTLF